MKSLLEIVLNEGMWPVLSVGVGLCIVLLCWRSARLHGLAPRIRWLWSLNLYFAFMVGTMASGHLLAVSIRHAQGTVKSEVPLALLYLLGLALLVPSIVLARGTQRYVGAADFSRRSIRWNLWLGLSLVVLDPYSSPLAVPALLNTAYALHTRRYLGWTILSLAAGSTIALLVGSLVFFASGKSFEDFSGM